MAEIFDVLRSLLDLKLADIPGEMVVALVVVVVLLVVIFIKNR